MEKNISRRFFKGIEKAKMDIRYSVLLASFLILWTPLLYAKKEFVTIGTGGVTGIYYPTGGAIAKLVNEKKDIYNVRASVESTGGSVFNVNALLSGDIEFGVVQSDTQYRALNGLKEWKEKGPQKTLRSVFSIHSEAVTLVASEKSKIKRLKDIKGKVINIGNHGSGQRNNVLDILSVTKLDWQKDFKAESLKAAEAPKMLQDGRIDAFFYTVGHPSGAITEATSGREKVRFIPIKKVKSLLKKYPYYAKTKIPKNIYPMAINGKKDIPTIGVKATLLTSSKVSDNVVYAITKQVFENLEKFKQLHPAFAHLNKRDMLKGLSAPLHSGAVKYYKESKLIKKVNKSLL